MKYATTLLLILISFSLLAQTPVSGSITSNTTWDLVNSPYEVTGNVTVETGATLTIEPGVTVLFTNNNFDLTIDGTLIADGTASDSIYFQNNLATIFITSNSTGSIIDHVRFDNMGVFNIAALHVSSGADISHSKFVDCEVGITVAGGASPTIQNCTMISSNDYGIRVDDGSPLISSVIIDGDKGVHSGSGGIWIQSGRPNISASTFSDIGSNGGIWVNTTDAPIIDNNTFSDNTRDVRTHPLLLNDIHYDNNGLSRIHVDPINITQNTTWHKPQFPEDWVYEMVFGNITVTSGNTLTIEAGVTIEYTNNSQNLFVQGALNAIGSASDSIRIRNGLATIELQSGSGPSDLQYIRLDDMGAFNIAGLVVNSTDVSVSHSKFVDCEVGITIGGGASPTIQNSTMISSNDYGIRVDDGSPLISSLIIDGDKDVHSGSGGIWIQSGSPNISASTFSNIGNNAGIWVNTTDVPTINNNTFSDNTRDIITHPELLNDEFYNGNGLTKVLVNTQNVSTSTTWKMAGSETWVYEALGQISVPAGVTLTIEPGFEMNLTNYTHDIEVEGTLIANGTAIDSIKINGPGGIDISENSINSQVSYLRYQGVGATSSGSTDKTFGAGLSIGGTNATVSNSSFLNTMIGLAVYNDAQPTVTECTFDQSSTVGLRSVSGNPTITNSVFENHALYGVEAQNGSLTFQNNSFSNNTTALYLNGVLNNPVIESNTFTGNTRDIITHPELLDDEFYDGNGFTKVYVNARTVNNSTIWHKVQSPETWEFEGLGLIQTAAGITLTLEPGFEITLINYTHDIEVEGTLIANGTESDSIRLNGPGGIDISENSTNSQVSYLRYQGVGATSSGSADRTLSAGLSIGGTNATVSNCSFLNTMIGMVVYNNAQPSITGSTFDESSIAGLRSLSGDPTVTNSIFDNHDLYGVELQSGSPTIQNSSIANTTTALYLNGVLNNPVIESNTFTGNTRDIITHPELLDDEFYDGNGFTTVYVNARTINNSTTWHKVQSPETWKFQGLGLIQTAVGITLTLEPGFEITLTGYTHDIEVEGTLIANGTESDSIRINGPGGIDISENSANSEVSYLLFEGVGATSSGSADRTLTAGLSIGGANTTISNSSFLNSAIGITVYNNSSPTISSCEFAIAAVEGVRVVNGSSSPTIENSCFSSISFDAVQNFGTGTIIATNNWWGDPSGPLSTAANPSGLGEEVSDGVTFDPWLTSDPCLPPEIVIDTQPSDQSICEDESTVFMIFASGAENLTYQWQIDTGTGFSDLNDNSTYSGTTTSTLSIQDASIDLDMVAYRCVVSGDNATDVISSQVDLLIGSAVIIDSSSPTTIALCEGEETTLSIETSGSDLITYSWYKEGSLLSNSTSEYILDDLQMTDEGVFKVIVENACGSDSTFFSLTLTELVSITSDPEDQSTVQGETIELSVEATGDNLAYQWQKDQVVIDGETTNTLILSTVDKQDEGLYRCVVSNSCNETNSVEALIQVCEPVRISSQSSDMVSVCEGENHTFSIINQGDATITYAWYKDDILLSGALNSSHELTGIDASDSGEYKVVTMNDCGTDSTIFQLEVLLSSQITSQPSDLQVTLGDQTMLAVQATGDNLSYQWQKDGSDISGETSDNLLIVSAGSQDEGLYRCVVSGTCNGIISAEAELAVCIPVSITNQSSNMESTCEGENHTFSITDQGDPTITYEWFKDGVLIPAASNSYYELTNTDKSDDGQYKVIATNDCGLDSAFFTLTLIESVSIVTQPQDQIVDEGTNVTFTIATLGDNLMYQWQKDETDIQGANNAVLEFPIVEIADDGVYRCLVSNECEIVTSNSAKLTVESTALGVDNNPLNLIIYPNPSNGHFTFKLPSGDRNSLAISISDLSGKQVYYQFIDHLTDEILIETNGISTGTYFISILSETKLIASTKVIIQ